MATAVLFPSFDHPAIEERYASWQAELRLRQPDVHFYYYPAGVSARDAAGEIEEEHALVVIDPLMIAAPRIAAGLLSAMGDADAAVPLSNVSTNPVQLLSTTTPYLTLRELDLVMDDMRRSGGAPQRVTWGSEDPSIFLCRTTLLEEIDGPFSTALHGRNVVVVRTEYVHRWASMRGQLRQDLLDRVSTDARTILEFGCGEGTLGEALKNRQKCRVVGIELDPAAAAVARRRIDDVYQGDAGEIVNILNEKFDWIIGGDIVEHLADPWSFLSDLRRVAAPGGHLLLSLPNLASASIIGDLLAGRFDYVYMGLACVGHLRFFTRRSIEELLRISGWTPVDITPQQMASTPAAEELTRKLEAAAIPFSRDDLAATGYYVIARND
jgi:SAM-dependent methyltransferase